MCSNYHHVEFSVIFCPFVKLNCLLLSFSVYRKFHTLYIHIHIKENNAINRTAPRILNNWERMVQPYLFVPLCLLLSLCFPSYCKVSPTHYYCFVHLVFIFIYPVMDCYSCLCLCTYGHILFCLNYKHYSILSLVPAFKWCKKKILISMYICVYVYVCVLVPPKA